MDTRWKGTFTRSCNVVYDVLGLKGGRTWDVVVEVRWLRF